MISERYNKEKNWVRLKSEDDEVILKLVEEYGTNWTRIASEMNFYNPLKIKNRYYNTIQKKGRFA